MIKPTHLITRLIFVLAVAQAITKASATDTNLGNSLLSGKELRVAITQVFKYIQLEPKVNKD